MNLKTLTVLPLFLTRALLRNRKMSYFHRISLTSLIRRFPLHLIINSVMRRTKLPKLKRNCRIISAKPRTVRVLFHLQLSKSTHSRRLFQNSLPTHRTRLKAVKHSFCRQRCSCLTERQASLQQRLCSKPLIRVCLN